MQKRIIFVVKFSCILLLTGIVPLILCSGNEQDMSLLTLQNSEMLLNDWGGGKSDRTFFWKYWWL